MSHFDLLKSCPLFSNLSDSEMILLEKTCVETPLPAHASLCTKGDTSKGFCLVKQGKLKVDGQMEKETTLVPGNFLGAFSLYKSGLKSKLNVSALENSSVLMISHQKFIQLVQNEPQIKLKVAFAVLSECLSDLDSTVETFSKV